MLVQCTTRSSACFDVGIETSRQKCRQTDGQTDRQAGKQASLGQLPNQAALQRHMKTCNQQLTDRQTGRGQWDLGLLVEEAAVLGLVVEGLAALEGQQEAAAVHQGHLQPLPQPHYPGQQRLHPLTPPYVAFMPLVGGPCQLVEQSCHEILYPMVTSVMQFGLLKPQTYVRPNAADSTSCAAMSALKHGGSVRASCCH